MSSTHFFFFNDTATTEIYTLSLHDALPIYTKPYLPLLRQQRKSAFGRRSADRALVVRWHRALRSVPYRAIARSEEHTSELQSRQYLVCRLLLEKKKKTPYLHTLHSDQHHIP